MDEWMGGWMDGWMDGMDEWMDGWNGWMDGATRTVYKMMIERWYKPISTTRLSTISISLSLHLCISASPHLSHILPISSDLILSTHPRLFDACFSSIVFSPPPPPPPRPPQRLLLVALFLPFAYSNVHSSATHVCAIDRDGIGVLFPDASS